MFKFLRHIRRRKMPPVILGISKLDWLCVRNEMQLEYEQARARQKNPAAGPNQYMLGLQKAINILESIEPYNIMEVR